MIGAQDRALSDIQELRTGLENRRRWIDDYFRRFELPSADDTMARIIELRAKDSGESKPARVCRQPPNCVGNMEGPTQ